MQLPNSSSEPTVATVATPGEILEATLREWLAPHLEAGIAATDPAAPRPGRPPVLPAMLLWLGVLVGVLRDRPAQVDVWRLLSVHGLWDWATVPVSDMAVYRRLARTGPLVIASLFRQVTDALKARLLPRTALDLAPFAPEVYAVDHTSLASVLRKRAVHRPLRKGDLSLIPGALACVWDVRRQLWEAVAYGDRSQDLRVDVEPLLARLPRGSLLLFDLGYFSFQWLDGLHDQGFRYVTRLLKRATYEVQRTLCDHSAAGVRVRDLLVYLGKYPANKAAVPVRVLELTVDGQTYRYVTNVTDPRQLPVWQVVALYRRRWDVEKAFDLVKTDLGLQLLWSGHLHALLQQVFATLVIAQVVLGLRNEVAAAAACDAREVSVRLLLRWLPALARMGRDPVAEFAAQGRKAGYIRPFRGKEWAVPDLEGCYPPRDKDEEPVPRRKARYPSRTAYYRRKAERAKLPKEVAAYRPYGGHLKK